MASSFHDFSSLRDDTEQARLDFIWTDLETCLTFAALAETEYKLGNRDHAEQTLASAEKGYSDMLGFYSQAAGLTPETEGQFQSKFKEVRERLDGLQAFR